MPGRFRAAEKGRRLADRMAADVADELRNARLGNGLTQAELGASIGVDRERISAVERHQAKALTVHQMATHAAALGLRLSVRFYPLGDPIRDAAQVRYINRFLARVGGAWKVKLDAPIPLPGDLRAIDVVLIGACLIAVEVITRLADIQATLRAAQLKQRDFGAARLVIVVAGTEANRRAIATARTSLGSAFDLDTQRVLRLLARGEDPGRDALVVLD